MISHPVIIEPTLRWIRVKFGGKYIADSKRALLLLEYGPGRLPAYYFPKEDVLMDVLFPTDYKQDEDQRRFWNLKVGDQISENAAYSFHNPPADHLAIKNYITFKWHLMDAWFEEEEVFVHARDPHKRVDVMASSRHIRIEIDGKIIAESQRPYLLFETNLPVRYYLPREDIKMDLLIPSKTVTRCPYKGVAEYWDVNSGQSQHKDFVWSYPVPILENPKIKDLMCFFNEKVDIYVDGDLQNRPQTPWS